MKKFILILVVGAALFQAVSALSAGDNAKSVISERQAVLAQY